jgi:hypothetical protein
LFLSYHRFPLPWYFSSWASGESHHSGFKSQILERSLWCVMFLVRCFYRYSIECCPGIFFQINFLTCTCNSRSPNDYCYGKAFHVPHSLNFCT